MKEIKTIDDINLINDLLTKGETLESIGKKDGFASTRTIQRHIKKIGFRYDRKLGILVPIEGVTVSNTKVTSTNKIETLNVANEDVKTQIKKNDSNNNSNVTKDDIANIIKRIEKIEKLMLQHNTNVTPLNINANTDITTRSIKVSKHAMNEFIELCESQFPMFNKQDLISLALLEFVKKYKK